MILRAKTGISWVIEAYRIDCDLIDFKSTISDLSKDSFTAGVAHTYGTHLQVAASTEADAIGCYDFATAVALSDECAKPRFIYIEELSGKPDHYLFLDIEDGIPKRCLVDLTLDDVLSELPEHEQNSDDFEFHAFGLNESGNEQGGVDFIPRHARLTETVQPSGALQYKPLKDVTLTSKSSNGRLKLVAIAIGVILIAVVFINPFSSKPDLERAVTVSNPWQAYENALTDEAIYAYERLLQDYAFHVLFNSVSWDSGWNLDGVNVSKVGQTYQFTRADGASEKHLEEFIKNNELLETVGEPIVNITNRSATIDVRGRNRPLPFAQSGTIMNVEELQHLLADGVMRYVPNSELVFVRDMEDGEFVKRQLELRFYNVHWDDLIGFGAMTRDYPVSFGRLGRESSLGGYEVSRNSQTLTGSLFLTLIGEL